MNPQTPNQAPFFGRKISKTGVNVTQATENQLILKEDYDQGNTIYYDDSGIPNVLIGKRLLTSVRGFYVARPGVDVTNATDGQLIFNSQNDVFKIISSSTVTIPSHSLGVSSSYYDTIQIAHGLSTIPILQAYGLVAYNAVYNNTLPPSIVTGYASLPFDSVAPFSGVGNIATLRINAIVDATNIYFPYYYSTNSSGSYIFPAVPIRYYLLQETVN